MTDNLFSSGSNPAVAVTPAADLVQAPAAPAVEAVPAGPAARATAASKKAAAYMWDGIERSMVTAINGVDINAASATELHRLPGVGASRAKDIIAYREQHGKFPNIYALASVPGIGEKLFRQITGLPLNMHRSRYVQLNGMLGLPPETPPSLKQVLERIAETSGAAGCLLTGLDGVPICLTKGVREEAPRLAAVTTQLFRKAGKRLLFVLQAEVECLALPLGNPPRLLFAGENFFLIVVEGGRRLTHREARRLGNIFKEVRWMLSRRAVVNAINL